MVGRVSALLGGSMLILVLTGLGLPLAGGHLAADAVLVVVGFQLGLAIRQGAGTKGWGRPYLIRTLGPIVVPTVVAIGLALASWWWLGHLDPSAARAAGGALIMAANLVPVVSEARFSAIDHLWLIGLIVQFALMAPIAVVQARRTGDGRSVVRAAVTLAAAVAGIRLALALNDTTSTTALAQITPTRTDGLLLGAAAALAPRSMLQRIPTTVATPALIVVLAVPLLAPAPAEHPLLALGLLSPVVIVAAAAVLPTLTTDRSQPRLTRLLDRCLLRWLGDRAIGFYVWHQLFGMALTTEAGDLFGSAWPGPGVFVTRVVFALAAGAASYRYLELPLRGPSDRARWASSSTCLRWSA